MYRYIADDGLQMQNQVVTNMVNGISNGVLVSNYVLLGSYIDDSILICPYNNSIEYQPVSKITEGKNYFKIVLIIFIVAIWIGVVRKQWKQTANEGYTKEKWTNYQNIFKN